MRTALSDLPYPLTLSRKGAWTLVPTAANCTGSLLHCAHSTASCCSFEKSFCCCAVLCKHSSVIRLSAHLKPVEFPTPVQSDLNDLNLIDLLHAHTHSMASYANKSLCPE